MRWFRPTIRDDRGAMVPVGPVKVRLDWFYMLLPAFLSWLVVLALSHPRLFRLGALPAGLATFFALLGLYIAYYKVRARRSLHHRTVSRAIGHCAACGQRLWGVPRQRDGNTVCPECGAAWRLPRSFPPDANEPAPEQSR